MSDDFYRALDASKLGTDAEFDALTATFRAGRIPESVISTLANSTEAKQTLSDTVQKMRDEAAAAKVVIADLTARLAAKETV